MQVGPLGAILTQLSAGGGARKVNVAVVMEEIERMTARYEFRVRGQALGALGCGAKACTAGPRAAVSTRCKQASLVLSGKAAQHLSNTSLAASCPLPPAGSAILCPHSAHVLSHRGGLDRCLPHTLVHQSSRAPWPHSTELYRVPPFHAGRPSTDVPWQGGQAAPTRYPPCLATPGSQGIALQADPDYSIVKECLPYLARRLLTDDSPRARQALKVRGGAAGCMLVGSAGGPGGSRFARGAALHHASDVHACPTRLRLASHPASLACRVQEILFGGGDQLSLERFELLLRGVQSFTVDGLTEAGTTTGSLAVAQQQGELPAGVGGQQAQQQQLARPLINSTAKEVLGAVFSTRPTYVQVGRAPCATRCRVCLQP